MSSPNSRRPAVLDGTRVLDLTHVLAGPFASYQLAVLGADVIKIEAPDEPDQARFQGSDPQLSDAGLGTAFLAQAANKRCLTLNLKSEAGRRVLRELVQTADVLIENYRPVSAFGSTGPKRELTAYDGVIQAYSGIMAMTGEPGTAAIKCGAPVVDYATGTTAAAAILAALLYRMNSGLGQHVEVAMSDVAAILCSSHLTGYLWNGAHPEQKGNRYPFATIGCYQASDGPLMISASNLRQQARLWRALNRSDMVKADNPSRIRAHAEEAEALGRIIATQTVDHWEHLLQAARVPVSRVQRMEAMLADAHFQGRGTLHRFEESAGPLKGLTVPVAGFRLSSCEMGVSAPPQRAGAQSRAILRGLGYGEADIDALEADGVV